MGLSDCCCQAALVWALCVASVLMTSFTDLYSVPLSLIFSHCISRLSYLSQVCMYHFGTLHSEFTFRCIACTVSYKVSSFFFFIYIPFFFPSLFCLPFIIIVITYMSCNPCFYFTQRYCFKLKTQIAISLSLRKV